MRNTAKWSPPLYPPARDARHDWEIFHELTWRLRGGGLRRPLAALARRALTPRRMVDLGLRAGPYGWRSPHRLSVRKLERHPHGIDLGPLTPGLPGRLLTEDRRIRLAPPLLVQDLDRAERELLAAASVATTAVLWLIGRRHLRSNNSWMHNSLRLVKGPPRCTLLMHPDDAGPRGLADGQRVRVRSRVGQVELPLELTSDIMPGVVSIPHGWGHGRPGTRLRVADAHAGVSINALTDHAAVDALVGTAVLNGTPVEVAAVA